MVDSTMHVVVWLCQDLHIITCKKETRRQNVTNRKSNNLPCQSPLPPYSLIICEQINKIKNKLYECLEENFEKWQYMQYLFSTHNHRAWSCVIKSSWFDHDNTIKLLIPSWFDARCRMNHEQQMTMSFIIKQLNHEQQMIMSFMHNWDFF